MANYLFLFITAVSFVAVNAVDDSFNILIIPSIRECYNKSYLLTRDNRLPHNMITLIEILRKIEDSPGSTMRTLTALSQALLHGFRQDGIKRLETTVTSNNVIPYAAKHEKFSRFVKLLRVIAGDAMTFPNNSISNIERCTLHFMLSDIVELEKRDDVNCNRNYDNAYRFPRSIDKKSQNIKEGENDDVEMLSPQEIQSMTNTKQDEDTGVDPNSFYPEYPPNHPAVAQYITEKHFSSCPVYNGVIKTRWGDVSAGPLIAAIAAGMQPQLISISQLMTDTNFGPEYFEGTPKINNKWFATLSGDLAAAFWLQAPKMFNQQPFVFGTNGKWNSSELPRWFFLDSNENIELTRPLLRGDIDGLIMALEFNIWSTEDKQRIRLSQVLDMYYSSRGSLNPPVRACNRKEMFAKLMPNTETLEEQTYSAMKIMKDLPSLTMDDNTLRNFSKMAVRQVVNDLATILKDDLSCADTDRQNDFSRTYVDLTIVLDTNWPFKYIQPILSKLLEGIEVMKYNSNFTLISGKSGNIMINSSNTILDLYNFNASNYEKFEKGFDMCRSIEIVERMLKEKLDREQYQRIGGGNMDAILFVPYVSSSEDDRIKECVNGIMQNMHLEIPDASVLFLTAGRKEMGTYYAKHEDVFVISSSPSSSNLYPIDSLISRLREFPRRLVNSKCGSRYNSQGQLERFVDSVEPRGTKFYRIHPNYFYTSDTTPKVIIEGLSYGQLTICESRQPLYSNSTKIDESKCPTINSNSRHVIELTCGDAGFIHHCQPYYISVRSNNSASTSYHCENCRFPDEVKYTISYENLICTSVANSLTTLPIIIILTIVSLFKFI
ncbi:uncharacterized protein LOC127282579 [Leptopilina boulardi]|uniref:uncharacterized protein LOC127282579 n=1 Tax=Leptopilina boulardi TaxID=63433 RepID=UPI0021F5B5EC|nr:uncharacterized protein LOC127282579 [Leptopilina boulardi]